MELPQPPQDEDLRNIIEKLAVFVARNGQEFESMTKQKQRSNPRFAFLFGGEFYNYYMYRVTTEQAVLKHKQSRQLQQQMSGGPGGPGGPPNFGGNQNFGMHGLPQRFPPPQQQSQMFEQSIREGGNFDRGFDQQQSGPPIQNFERPQMQNFDRPGMPNFQNFDRQQSGSFSDNGPPGNFDRQNMPPNNSFDQRPGQGNFEQRPFGGNFDQRPGSFDPRPKGFDRGPDGPSPENFENRQGAGMFNRPGAGSGSNFERPNMDLRPGSAPNFDRGPTFDRGSLNSGGNFERASNPPFDRGHSGGGPNFERVLPGNSSNFDRPNPSGPNNFDRAPGGMSLDQRLNMGTNFERPGPPQPGPAPSLLPNAPSPAPVVNIEALKAQKLALEEQIRQSEKNLAGQQQVLMAQQQQQIEESIRIVQDAEIKQLCLELNVNMDEFDVVLGPIIESCTKDAISNGKAWIFTHTSTQRHYTLVTNYLLRKTTDPESSFNKRLHIIYLVNDVLHHCMRKGAEDLQQVLEAMVIPMFCYSKVAEATNEENVAKLDKLFSLWESKSNYVSKSAVEKLRNYSQTWLEYQAELMKRHAVVVAQIATNMQQTYENYQNQHQMFCQHVVTSVKALEQQIQQAVLQQQLQLQQHQMALARNQIPLIAAPPDQNFSPNVTAPGPGLVITPPNQIVPGPTNTLASQLMTGYPGQGQSQAYMNQMAGQGPQVGDSGNSVNIPDISRPPPGFPTPPPEKELIPSLPYYELPAGLMVPLVKHEDDNYKPIDPKAIRLPPPCPPSERLIQAVEAFYSQPTHDLPRDSEGWERLGLYEYYKTKNIARKKKEDDIREGKREKSRSPTPIRRESSPGAGRSPPRRRYQSKSPTPPKRRRSRSRSPNSRRRKGRRSRSKSRSPGRRSPTPPSFGTPGLGMERKLDESNKGHQLLKKMGWGGTGLGANEQGIEAPISGGELREKKDQYKGVGISMNDPFESYRKSKGQAFVERMRQRAEERL